MPEEDVYKRQGLTLAIATNGLPGPQRGRYVRTGLDKLVPNLFISMELGAQKPQAEFFERVLEVLKVSDRRRTVMAVSYTHLDVYKRQCEYSL